MFENIEEQVFQILKKYGKISTVLVMKKFKLNAEFADKLCQKARLRQHKYAKSKSLNAM